VASDRRQRHYPATLHYGSRRLAWRLRDLSRKQLESQRGHECHDAGDSQYRRCAIGKAVWPIRDEVKRFDQRVSVLRDIDVDRSVMGASFIVIIGLVSAVGTSLVYGIGGFLVIRHVFTTVPSSPLELTSQPLHLTAGLQMTLSSLPLGGQLRARL